MRDGYNCIFPVIYGFGRIDQRMNTNDDQGNPLKISRSKDKTNHGDQTGRKSHLYSADSAII